MLLLPSINPGPLQLMNLARFLRLSAAGMLVLLGCHEKEAPPIKILLTAQFRGPVHIIEAKDGSQIALEKGEYVYRIPSDGTLRVKKALGFPDWHKIFAFRSGVQLPVRMTTDPERPGDQLVVYETGGLNFFVGTRQEMLEFMKRPTLDTEATRFWSGEYITNRQGPVK